MGTFPLLQKFLNLVNFWFYWNPSPLLGNFWWYITIIFPLLILLFFGTQYIFETCLTFIEMNHSFIVLNWSFDLNFGTFELLKLPFPISQNSKIGSGNLWFFFLDPSPAIFWILPWPPNPPVGKCSQVLPSD